jgi:tRNA(fMet)-specific endonuclease VapC
MRFLLDTCVVSDFVQGHQRVLDRVRSSSPADLAASTITEMEVHYGLALNPRLARQIGPVLHSFFGALSVLPYDRDSATASASIRADLKRRGQPIGAYDILIAGAAIAHNLVLVTSNVREFKQVQGLALENWRT